MLLFVNMFIGLENVFTTGYLNGS